MTQKPTAYIDQKAFSLAAEQLIIVASTSTDADGKFGPVWIRDPEALAHALLDVMGAWAGVEFRVRRRETTGL